MPPDVGNLTRQEKAATGLRILTRAPHLLRNGAIPALKAFAYSRARCYGW